MFSLEGIHVYYSLIFLEFNWEILVESYVGCGFTLGLESLENWGFANTSHW